jgi:hypothetical protein
MTVHICEQILSENVRRIEEVAQRHKTHFSTIFRWIFKGLPAPSGERVRLEACRLGAKWVTSDEAVARFSAALTPALDGEPAPTSRSATKRQQASERAARELVAKGI